MLRIVFVFLLITFIGCTKPEAPELVISKTIQKLDLANTVTYNVHTIYKKAFEKDTIQSQSSYKFKKIEYEPYLGYHFSKKEADSFSMFYETLKLFNVNDKNKTVTEYSFKNNANVGVLYKHGGNQQSFPGILKVLKEFQNDNTIEYKGNEKVNNKNTYAFTAVSKRNKANIVNYFWIDAKTYDILKLKTIQTVFRNNTSDYTFYICNFYDIKFNEQIDDNTFKPNHDNSYTKTINEFDPENPTILSKGNKAPSWELKDTKGISVKSNFVNSDKFTFIEAWKSSCDHCTESIPILKELTAKFNEKVNFISVNFDNNPNETISAVNNYEIDYPVLLGDEDFKNNYEIQAYPSFFIIDKEGNIIYSEYGSLKDHEFELTGILRNIR